MVEEEQQMATSSTIDLLIGPPKRWTPSGNFNNLKQFPTTSPLPPLPQPPRPFPLFSPLTKDEEKNDQEIGQLSWQCPPILGAFNPAAECNLKRRFPLRFIMSMKSTHKAPMILSETIEMYYPALAQLPPRRFNRLQSTD